MALKSSLFAGDARVEAIAVSDASNVKYGDRGPHVAKIQQALNLIEKAGLEEDSVYGARTQQAVLDYKRARKIINYSYQMQADAIVGKMTIAALDDEVWRKEQEQPPKPSGPITVRVLRPLSSPADDYREKMPNRHSPMLSFAISQAMLNAAGLPVPAAAVQAGASVATNATVDIMPGQTALVEVKGGENAGVYITYGVVKVVDPVTDQEVRGISLPKQSLKIVALSPGSTFVTISRVTSPHTSDTTFLPVNVRKPMKRQPSPTMDPPHDHRPSRKWSEVCSKIKQPKTVPEGLFLAGLCANKSPPESFVSWAFTFLNLKGGPVSTTHLNWYLHGNGADFIENRNIEQWIARDSGLRAEVARHIRSNKMQKQPYYSSMDFESKMYDNMEYYYAFGRIEALFIDFDINVRYVTISFKDIYEWHPICEPYYTPKPGDRVRDDNSLHAAMVEMKEKGARDYWMIGEATRPMSDFGL